MPMSQSASIVPCDFPECVWSGALSTECVQLYLNITWQGSR